MDYRVNWNVHRIIREQLLDKNAFPKVMAVYMHELLHQFGGDASRQFRVAILAMNYRIMEKSAILEEYEKEWRKCENEDEPKDFSLLKESYT